MKKEEAIQFKNHLRSIKADFSCVSTNYSTRIKYKKKNFVFSDQELTKKELELIQRVRNDADNFEGYITKNQSGQIDFFKFYDTVEERQISGYKLDLNSAYWTTAINIGLLSEETVDFFEKSGLSKSKKSRLIGLGSLATKRVTQKFVNGKLEKEDFINNELHTRIYITICEIVSELMAELSMKFHDSIIYYYWDCIFVKENIDIFDVVNFCEERNYEIKIEGETDFYVSKGEYNSFIMDIETLKKYPIRNES